MNKNPTETISDGKTGTLRHEPRRSDQMETDSGKWTITPVTVGASMTGENILGDNYGKVPGSEGAREQQALRACTSLI